MINKKPIKILLINQGFIEPTRTLSLQANYGSSRGVCREMDNGHMYYEQNVQMENVHTLAQQGYL